MSRFIYFLSSLFIAVQTCLSGIIVEADDLDNVLTHLQDLNSQTLVLWDVDETLITPQDQIYHPNSAKLRSELIQQYFFDKSVEEKYIFLSQMLNTSFYRLVDSRLPSLISDLQAQGIRVMALTAMWTGSLGIIPCMEEWRYNQLKLHNIDFSPIFPEHSRIEWSEMMRCWDRSKWNSWTVSVGNPVYHEGILITDGPDKGLVLVSFLNKVEWKPERVIFIDDHLSFLQSVQESMDEMGIDFTGIHFRALEKEMPSIDHDIAHLQFQHIANNGVWLTDEQARLKLSATP